MVQDKENKKITVKNKEKGQTHPDIEKLKKSWKCRFPTFGTTRQMKRSRR